MIRQIRIRDSDYPRGLYDIAPNQQPHSFTVEGDFSPAAPRVAIVGAREAIPDTLAKVRRLAHGIASRGGIVISGGARGVDSAAHEAALDAGGRTWSVIGCGGDHITPHTNEKLFARILAHGGAIVRTREDDKVTRSIHLDRNRVLVALADVLVVAQAKRKGGTRSSATWGVKLRRPTWMVLPQLPVEEEMLFEGTFSLIEACHPNVRVLWSEDRFFSKLFGTERMAPPKDLTDDELKVFEVLGNAAKHPDEIALETGLPTPAVTTALLTLALGDVVVEGSAGLFHRKNPP